tara:strand:+ start:737 stop:865 length:129 start_codon:yes stop_codon:yes gene_type:complete
LTKAESKELGEEYAEGSGCEAKLIPKIKMNFGIVCRGTVIGV